MKINDILGHRACLSSFKESMSWRLYSLTKGIEVKLSNKKIFFKTSNHCKLENVLLINSWVKIFRIKY